MDPTKVQIIAAANAGHGHEYMSLAIGTGVEVALCLVVLHGLILLFVSLIESMTDEDDDEQ